MHTLDTSRAPLAFGSDWPVSSETPLDGIAIARRLARSTVSRTAGGLPTRSCRSNRHLPRTRKVWRIRLSPKAIGDTSHRGASADLIWLECDPRATAAPELLALQVRATYLQGQSGYSARRKGGKGNRHLRAGVRPATPLICEFIDEHREEFGVVRICRALAVHGVQIAPHTYRAHRSSAPSKRALGTPRSPKSWLLRTRRQGQNARPRALYGSLKMWAHLQRQDIPVARRTVERIMRRNGWCGAQSVIRYSPGDHARTTATVMSLRHNAFSRTCVSSAATRA